MSKPATAKNGDRSLPGKGTRTAPTSDRDTRRTGRAAEVQGLTKGEGRQTTASAALPPADAAATGAERSAEIRHAARTSSSVHPDAPGPPGAGADPAAGAPGVLGGLGGVATGFSTVEPTRNGAVGSGATDSQAAPPTRTAGISNEQGPVSPPSQPEPAPPSLSKTSGEAPQSQGSGLPAIAVQIERPHGGTTSHGTQVVAGQVTGGTPKVVVVQLNESQQLLDVWGTRFDGEVSLREGKNQIRVVAMGPQGPLAEKSVEVQYAPPAASPALKIVRPLDGAVFDGPGQDLIEVEGEVSEPGTDLARVVFNEFSVSVPVKDGRFMAIVPAIAPDITIRTEVQGGGRLLGSNAVRVHRKPFSPVRGYVLLHLPSNTRKVDGRLLLLQRVNPADPDSQKKVTSHFPVGSQEAERTSALFTFPTNREGAYAAGFDYRVPAGESVEKGWAVVFVPSAGMYRSLRLGPFQLTGKGRVILAKFIAPQGIFWDEDAWFTGTAESAESLTKFRYSSSLSWTERKGEPEFPTGR